MFTKEQLFEIGRTTPEALIDTILLLQEQVQDATSRITQLEEQIAKNSRNSSKPPSSDGLKGADPKPKPKPKSLRKKTNQKQGGQEGHTGHTLEQTETPDHTIHIPVTTCSCCTDLTNVQTTNLDCRQVFEIPEPKLEVFEYQSEIKICPNCGQTNKGQFPEGVNSSVQYGPRFRGMLVYMQNQHFIPAARLSQMVSDLYGTAPSVATILNASSRIHDNLASFEEEIVETLSNSKILHVDESGLRVVKKLYWLHSASTETVTFYGVHEKRGALATDHFNILPQFSGRLIHDFWKPYFKYDCDHGLCNAHHLRELVFLFEQQGQLWAKDMFELLLDMNVFVNEQNMQLSSEQMEPWIKWYREIIADGWAENPLPKKLPKKKKRGRRAKTKAQNLLVRLGEFEESVLAFLHDASVPFTNNLAEQDIRMIKVRQKISGCFRSVHGAEYFARIRSYLSTARKQGRNILDSITDAINGTPFHPAASFSS